MSYEEHYDTIERYITGELQGEALSEFMDAMSKDSELANEVEMHRLILDLKDEDKVSFASKEIKRLIQEDKKVKRLNSRTRIITLRRLTAIAATIAILLVTYFTFIDKPVNQGAELYAYALEQGFLEDRASIDNPFQSRGGDELTSQQLDYLTLWNQANEYYSSNQINDAMKTLQNINTESLPDQNSYHFFKGILYQGLGNLKAAESEFKSVNATTYRPAAQWELAIMYLKKNDLSSAKTLLEFLAEDPIFDYKKDECKRLLNKLKVK